MNKEQRIKDRVNKYFELGEFFRNPERLARNEKKCAVIADILIAVSKHENISITTLNQYFEQTLDFLVNMDIKVSLCNQDKMLLKKETPVVGTTDVGTNLLINGKRIN